MKLLFLKMCFEAIHSNRYIPHVNGLLFRGFREITSYLYTYNIIYDFIIPNVSCYIFTEAIIQRIRLVRNTLMNLWQKPSEAKYFIAEESPFPAEQNDKIHYCVGYFIYEIHGLNTCVCKSHYNGFLYISMCINY